VIKRGATSSVTDGAERPLRGYGMEKKEPVSDSQVWRGTEIKQNTSIGGLRTQKEEVIKRGGDFERGGEKPATKDMFNRNSERIERGIDRNREKNADQGFTQQNERNYAQHSERNTEGAEKPKFISSKTGKGPT